MLNSVHILTGRGEIWTHIIWLKELKLLNYYSIKWVSQGYIASKWQSSSLKPSLLVLNFHLTISPVITGIEAWTQSPLAFFLIVSECN